VSCQLIKIDRNLIFCDFCGYFRLSRARRCIENAFGVMTARYRVLRRTLLATRRTAKAIIQAVVVMHNFHLMRNREAYAPANYMDWEDRRGNVVRGRWRQEVGQDVPAPIRQQDGFQGEENANRIREEFVDYFLDAGAVPWQWRHLRRLT